MGIGSSLFLFIGCFLGIFFVLLYEILKLSETIDESIEERSKLHDQMSTKIADVEIEKMHLENKIMRLEETIALWQTRSRHLTNKISFLTDDSTADFDDEQTRETDANWFRRAS